MWIQKKLILRPKSRGFHLITREIVEHLPELVQFEVGLAHFFLQHTSASLSVNENADPSVRQDFEAFLNWAVPENAAFYSHTTEGPDDMPAHIKSSLLGSEVTVPVAGGKLMLGTWQGIYLGEYRNQAGSRTLVVTLQGE
ncbi:MAG: secondary thiamine-phosphate synthase enzyme YjbQ [Gammaproteobacteria bacterium]